MLDLYMHRVRGHISLPEHIISSKSSTLTHGKEKYGIIKKKRALVSSNNKPIPLNKT